ncbi:MAG: cob(I)yrinic acid a,c-diamide adenosyltransferase [Spirochaetales bacterium]|uniref:corrinoid adenosyltransferase n=1 Tax=Candidatus Thalassospirochaeta sargassi TaxID=3119039 RepID=A0AAJ1IE52_9SPIO|nr:cob(I)yrinic acid a,c-diamide adenosyltransferase [Spirochaetales bacterium]
MKNQPENVEQLKTEHEKKIKNADIDRGVVIVNTGDGKGKSTAAFGTAFRAVGYGMKVGIVQFIKGKWKTGEQQIFAGLPQITHVISGEGFTWNSEDNTKDIEAARKGWEFALGMIEEARDDEDSYQLIVLDEINIAMDKDFIPAASVVEAIKAKPEHLSIILTGRNAPPEIIEAADTVTEMKPIKHAFEGGIKARKGIEF